MAKKIVIYYFYDKEGNRRPVEVGTLDNLEMSISKIMINKQIQYMPHLKNNYYVQIDSIEFKLD